ncbi:MAG: hypothetical protein Q8R28_23265 [Dehalococcoidia bacterium]|nr:hypothetical protein [Dehalococcoidia bacterium]
MTNGNGSNTATWTISEVVRAIKVLQKEQEAVKRENQELRIAQAVIQVKVTIYAGLVSAVLTGGGITLAQIAGWTG